MLDGHCGWPHQCRLNGRGEGRAREVPNLQTNSCPQKYSHRGGVAPHGSASTLTQYECPPPTFGMLLPLFYLGQQQERSSLRRHLFYASGLNQCSRTENYTHLNINEYFVALALRRSIMHFLLFYASQCIINFTVSGGMVRQLLQSLNYGK